MYLWEWVNELASPISYSELNSWCELCARKLSKWEIEVMIALDGVRGE